MIFSEAKRRDGLGFSHDICPTETLHRHRHSTPDTRMGQRHVRRAPDGLAQREGPVGSQFHDQPLGQRLQRTVIFLIGRIRAITILDRGLLAQLVLGPDIATIDRETAVPIQRDEDVRARDLGIIVDQRPLFERFQRHLELTEPSVDLIGIFVLAGLFFLQRTILGEERSVGRAFLLGHRSGIAGQTPQTVAVAIGQVSRHLDPLPALGDQRLGFCLKLLGDQPVEEGRVLEPATVIALEEITQHKTACLLIGIDTHENCATI